jgi:hypothetical protein
VYGYYGDWSFDMQNEYGQTVSMGEVHYPGQDLVVELGG